MTINKKPPKTDTESVDRFVSGAPDAGASETATMNVTHGVIKGTKRQITVTISPALLDSVDRLAEQRGMSRAGLINMFLFEGINRMSS